MGKKKKKSSGRGLLKAACWVFGLIFTGMLGITVYAEYLLGKMNYSFDGQSMTLEEAYDYLTRETDPEDDNYTGPEMDAGDVQLGQADRIEAGAHVVNVLLVGADYQSGDRARSDSMILCTFNTKTDTITMTSLMRDMYVQIPGYYSNRINAAYAIGGMELLQETLVYNFGLQVDGVVEVDFSRFEELIDLLGGVEIELSGQEASFINTKNGDSLSAGTHTLNGAQALWYSRFRGDSSGDFGRTNRQRVVLGKLLEGYRGASLKQLLGMMDDILPMITTDLSKREILGYVKDLFPMLTDAQLVTQRIPAEGGYYMTRIDGMSVLVPDMKFNIEILKDTIEQ